MFQIDGSNAYESSTIKFEVPRYQQKSPFTTSNFMKKSPSHYNYDDVILEELSEWFRRNPFVTHLEFVKTILKISSDEEEERVDGSDGDFLSRNFYDGFTEEGKKLLPYIKEFLSDEDQQNALRRSCIKESYKDLYGKSINAGRRGGYYLDLAGNLDLRHKHSNEPCWDLSRLFT